MRTSRVRTGLVACVLAACGGTLHVRDGAIEAVAVPETEMVELARPLASGDWLVVTQNELAMRRVSRDGTQTRWRIEERFVDAIAVGDDAIGVGVVAQHRVAFRVGGDGHLRWTKMSDAITRALGGRVVRVGATTVIATEDGELAIDDAGAVHWQHLHAFASTVAAAVVAGGVAIATMNGAGRPGVVRVLDPATGEERGRAEFVGANTILLDVLPRGDRFAVRVDDPATLTVFDARTATVIERFDVPRSLAASHGRPHLGPGEVAFLDHYANREQGQRELGLTIVDLATHRARRVVVLGLGHVDVGTGLDSMAQMQWTTNDGAVLAFAGLFDGELELGRDALRGDVQYVDRCEAAGHIECTEGMGMTMVATFVGIFGAIDLR